MKTYKCIFFDWDGTAVVSRTSSPNEVIKPMIQLLQKGVLLIIISGTTYNNIANGELHNLIPEEYQHNLYLGLGRGAYNYGFKNGEPILLNTILPSLDERLLLHKITFLAHQHLLRYHNLNTEIVFTRPNYCKLDLMIDMDRKDSLFLQTSEIAIVEAFLKQHHLNGLKDILSISEAIGNKNNLPIKVTTDAKYAEIGLSTKSDNVNYYMNHILPSHNVTKDTCCFFGDEFTYLASDIKGSDSYMITPETKDCDFFDVSSHPLHLPAEVVALGNGTKAFINFLYTQLAI